MRDELNKKYYKIGDVAILLDVRQSTIRFWESKFSFVRPYRDGKGNRYFTPKNIEQLRMIKYLLRDRGLKIDAAVAELNRNRQGVEKRFEVVERLKGVKSELEKMLKALDLLRYGDIQKESTELYK